jgi:FkbM family methyltransferase
MKNEVVVKEGGWIWPKKDERSWQGQIKQKELAQYILPYVVKNDVMIQAGGNCGFILSTFVPYFNNIYTFEPDPINFYCLNQNVTAPSVIKMQCCLGKESTPVAVQHLQRGIGEGIDIGGVHVSGVGFTPTIVIDKLNLQACDLIQLDIEGYELNALLGAVETIKKYKPVLCIEFCENWLNRYEATSDSVETLLVELGYKHVESYQADRIYITQ